MRLSTQSAVELLCCGNVGAHAGCVGMPVSETHANIRLCVRAQWPRCCRRLILLTYQDRAAAAGDNTAGAAAQRLRSLFPEAQQAALARQSQVRAQAPQCPT